MLRIKAHRSPRISHCLTGILLLLLALCCSCDEPEISIKQPHSVPGVTDDQIIIGSSLALEGHAGYLGARTLSGAMACIRDVNDGGGILGRKIKIIAYDDGYDPPRCLADTQRLIVDDRVFALFCYLGTPTTVRILPMVEQARIPLVGMFTGADALRTPFNPWLVNIRASYYQETEFAIRHMVQDLGLKQIAVFYQYDTFGFDGLTGAELALGKFGLSPVARGSYIRGTDNINDGLKRIRNSGAEAVIMIGTYGPCAKFIRRAAAVDFTPLFYSVSFTGAQALARRLPPDPDITLIMSQAVPSPEESDSALDYVRVLKKYYPNETPSFPGLEGYLNARVLVEGLRRAGRNLDRAGFIKAIESINDFKIGSDVSISYSDHDHQGMNEVFFTLLKNGRFVMLRNWDEVKKKLTEQHGPFTARSEDAS